MPDQDLPYRIIVIGSSAGGMKANEIILSQLQPDFPLPIVIAQHISADSENYLVTFLDRQSPLTVLEASEKELLLPGHVYIAPPNYHVLIESNMTISLSTEQKVNFARPSIDVLFESAALSFGSQVIGLLLTGANHDGAKGLKLIHQFGGKCIIENPETADVDTMPRSAQKLFRPDYILDLELIPAVLNKLLR